MQNILKYKKIIITVAVIIVAFFIYSIYFKPSQNGALVAVENQSGRRFAAGKEILTLLIDLKSIELDGSIFEDESFKSLEDFSLPIDPEPKGRINPFAPIGVGPVDSIDTVDEI